jgi:acetate---CoA ligase (ADP-forming)
VAGHAVYHRVDYDSAEVALEVADDLHGRGIGTILLAHLTAAAEREGIGTFMATVHPANHKMFQVFRESGLAVRVSAAGGVLHVEMPASVDADARERFESRDRIAAVAAVTHVRVAPP